MRLKSTFIQRAGVVAKIYEKGGVPHADMDLTTVNQKDEVLISSYATFRPWKS